MKFRIYRYRPETDATPWMQDYTLDPASAGPMLLDALLAIQAQDDSLALRRSCREGVCGSDAVNVNGKNCLACITPLAGLAEPVEVRPLPGLPVIRDLVVDMAPFHRQYQRMEPWLVNLEPPPPRERLQTPEARAMLDGAWECILCGCCTTACPSFWWHPERFVGPAGLLAAWRFVADSRDASADRRLDRLEDPYALLKCRGVMHCVEVCPKGLNPTAAIGQLRDRLLARG